MPASPPPKTAPQERMLLALEAAPDGLTLAQLIATVGYQGTETPEALEAALDRLLRAGSLVELTDIRDRTGTTRLILTAHGQLHLLTLPAPPATPGQDRAQATPARTAP